MACREREFEGPKWCLLMSKIDLGGYWPISGVLIGLIGVWEAPSSKWPLARAPSPS